MHGGIDSPVAQAVYFPLIMENIINRFLAEDIGAGDVTTNSIVPENHRSRAVIVAKEDCVIAGQEYGQSVFRALDPGVSYEAVAKDGESVTKGSVVTRMEAQTKAILTGERVALNILQRLSGIATATRRFADAVEGTGAVILDTRKTTPGLRAMEKLAVRMGGGSNHRFDLSEMALIKENHITIAGSIGKAVTAIRKKSPVPIEVEVKNMNELVEAVELKVDRIMLDNWKDSDVPDAVGYVRKRIPLEVSGNMTVERARQLAQTGIDYISTGSITHSFTSADLSLLIE
jgi:nicotinate-nucleotide pyrophosphorylase (carboxylating)